MQQTLENHRETALESPYSHDRKDAIKSLSELFPSVGDDEKRQIIETLRTVGIEATGQDERQLAVEKLEAAFRQDPAIAAPSAVPFFCELATDGRTSDTRLSAIDTLREMHSDVGATRQDEIGSTLSEIAGEATYEDERKRARQRLSDIAAEDKGSAGAPEKNESESKHIRYLGISLAEHLANSVDESPEACERRAREISDFLSENPVSDSAYDDIEAEINQLVKQLDAVPTKDGLGNERKERVRDLATRVKAVYKR
jgi:hypothetical protein